MERSTTLRQVSEKVDEEVNLNFYTEKATRFIYEVQFLEDFIIARPATPDFYGAIRQMTWEEFDVEFEEYWGDRMQLASYLHGLGEDDDDKDDISLME